MTNHICLMVLVVSIAVQSLATETQCRWGDESCMTDLGVEGRSMLHHTARQQAQSHLWPFDVEHIWPFHAEAETETETKDDRIRALEAQVADLQREVDEVHAKEKSAKVHAKEKSYRFAVVSAQYGEKDKISKLPKPPPGVKCVFYTDNKSFLKKTSGWTIVTRRYHKEVSKRWPELNAHGHFSWGNMSKITDDNVSHLMATNFYKTSMHVLPELEGMKAYVWLDADLLTGFNKNFAEHVELMLGDYDMVVQGHEKLSSSYDEISPAAERAEVQTGYSHAKEDMLDGYRNMSSRGFNDNFGFFNSGCFLVNAKKPVARSALEAWWHELQLFTFMDQNAFPFVLQDLRVNVTSPCKGRDCLLEMLNKNTTDLTKMLIDSENAKPPHYDYAVVSAQYGKKDKVLQLPKPPPGVKCVFYTEDESLVKNTAGWTIITRPYHTEVSERWPKLNAHGHFSWDNISNITSDSVSHNMAAKFYKMNMYVLPELAGMNAYFWLDADLLTGFSENFEEHVELMVGDHDMVLQQHEVRSSSYSEIQPAAARAATETGYNHAGEDILDAYKSMERRGFKDDIGLFNCGSFLVNAKNPVAISALEAWWHEVQLFTFRDQISFPFILQDLKVNFTSPCTGKGCLLEMLNKNTTDLTKALSEPEGDI